MKIYIRKVYPIIVIANKGCAVSIICHDFGICLVFPETINPNVNMNIKFLQKNTQRVLNYFIFFVNCKQLHRTMILIRNSNISSREDILLPNRSPLKLNATKNTSMCEYPVKPFSETY